MGSRGLGWVGLLWLAAAACSNDDGGAAVGGGAAVPLPGGAGGQDAGGGGAQAGGGAAGGAGGAGTGAAGGAAGAGGEPPPGCDGAVVNGNIGFEDGTFLDQWQLSPNNGEDCEMSVVGSPVRSGSHALHITHSIQGSGNYNRCEVTSRELLDPSASSPGRFAWNAEYWLGYSIYLEDWSTDPATWNVLGQTHAIPFDEDWSCCSGPQFWEVTTSLDEFQVAYSVIDDPYVTPVCSGGYTEWGAALAAMQNRWIDIVIHFDAALGDDGFVEVWVDGIQVIDQQGAVLYAYDSCGRPRTEELVLQMGSYKTTASTNYRSVYYDEIRVAGADGCYDTVAPRD